MLPPAAASSTTARRWPGGRLSWSHVGRSAQSYSRTSGCAPTSRSGCRVRSAAPTARSSRGRWPNPAFDSSRTGYHAPMGFSAGFGACLILWWADRPPRWSGSGADSRPVGEVGLSELRQDGRAGLATGRPVATRSRSVGPSPIPSRPRDRAARGEDPARREPRSAGGRRGVDQAGAEEGRASSATGAAEPLVTGAQRLPVRRARHRRGRAGQGRRHRSGRPVRVQLHHESGHAGDMRGGHRGALDPRVRRRSRRSGDPGERRVQRVQAA